MFAAKEQAYRDELQVLMKEDTKKSLAGAESRNKSEFPKEKWEGVKDSFLKKELDECKKRNTDMIKENSALRNKLIEISGQNETQSKTIAGLNRKLEDLNSRLKKNETANKPPANIANLNELRMSRKKQQVRNSDLVNKSVEHLPKEEYKRNMDETSDTIKIKKLNESSISKTVGLKSTTARLIMCKPSAQDTLGIAEDSTDTTSKRYIQSTTRNTILIQKKPVEVKKETAWKCIHTESLSCKISSLASFDQYLISSSSVIKLWDINKRVNIAETAVESPHILFAYDSQKVLIAANEQGGELSFYLLPGLELIQTIETGLSSVKALYADKNILFVGGSGDVGALQLWDVRTMARLSAKEKDTGNDVHSILTKKATIYYGGSNKCVNRVSLDTLVILHTRIGESSFAESSAPWCGKRIGESQGNACKRVREVLAENVGL